MAEFIATAEEVRRMEKKLAAYAPYSGSYDLVQTLDLEPKEYVDMSYPELLNLYERSQKIISTVSLGLRTAKEGEAAAAAAQPPVQTVETKEVETKLRQMTTETLQKAEEVASTELEREAVRPPPPPPEETAPAPEKMEIEFEHRPAAEKIELEKEKAPAVPEMEIPAETTAEKAPETKPAAQPPGPAVELPERKMVIAALPPALKQSPNLAAGKRYEQMEEQVRAALGGATDEITLKKKMLELTKQLFKEKSVNQREEIKLQITILKNMLAAPGAMLTGRKGKKGSEDETHSKLLETIMNTQQAELAHTKDTVIDSYNKQISSIKKKFYEDIGAAEEPERRKHIFEAFVFSVTSLVEQLPEVTKKYRDFTAQKHSGEIEKLRSSLADGEKDTLAKADERLGYIQKSYDSEFAAVKTIIGREIDSMIDTAGRDVFRKGEGEAEDKEGKALEIVKDVNDTDEGTLLYFLHANDVEYYRKYERKQLSKAEALLRAKALMARDRGLSESMVKKYWSGTEV